jgi:hypothetical protein
MKYRIAVLLALLTAGAAFGGTVGLYDWAFNVNGTVYSWAGSGTEPYVSPPPGYLPTSGAVAFNASAFDWQTGLGVLTINYRPSPGPAFFVGFFDHEFDVGSNGAFNEFVFDPAVLGTLGLLASGQRWEADEPGWDFGDIYTDATGGGNNLDNLNAVPPAFPYNASMALGWNFVVPNGYREVITLSVGQAVPGSGFYLRQQDVDTGEAIYFSGSVVRVLEEGSEPPDVPEPGTWAMLAGGIAAVGLIRRRRSPKQ